MNGSAVDVRSTVATDSIVVSNNVIDGALSPVQLGGSATAFVQNNWYGTNAANGSAINYRSGFSPALSTYAARQAVATLATGSQYYSYHYIEYSGTGTIRTVATGNTGKLYQQFLGDIK